MHVPSKPIQSVSVHEKGTVSQINPNIVSKKENEIKNFINEFSREIKDCRKEKKCKALNDSLKKFDSEKFDTLLWPKNKESLKKYIVDGLKSIVAKNPAECEEIMEIYKNNKSNLVGDKNNNLYHTNEWNEIEKAAKCLKPNNLNQKNDVAIESENKYSEKDFQQFQKIKQIQLGKLIGLETSAQSVLQRSTDEAYAKNNLILEKNNFALSSDIFTLRTAYNNFDNNCCYKYPVNGLSCHAELNQLGTHLY